MTVQEIRKHYLDYMKQKGHAIVPSSSLVPENDPTTLFTGSGMQPMLSYLLGEKHPLGDKISDVQKCFRSEDIEEVGDNRHTTFFEMLGNWSLGSYWKEEQLTWFFEFLTKKVGLSPEKLYVTTFIGDPENNIPKDTESAVIWKKLFRTVNIDAKEIELGSEQQGSEKGMQDGRIFYYEAKKNWWSRGGEPKKMPVGEPGGPDSEVFYCFDQVEHDPSFGEHCHPNCDCGRFLEIGNSVFMEYIKTDKGFEQLPQRNVDFGGGLERIAAASNDDPDVFSLDVFSSLISIVEAQSKQSYKDNLYPIRLLADHTRAAVFMIADGVVPSNKAQGYFLRRLIRRSVMQAIELDLELGIMGKLAQRIITSYQENYPDLDKAAEMIISQLEKEEAKFRKVVVQGQKKLSKDLQKLNTKPSLEQLAAIAFDFLQTHGLPFEVSSGLLQRELPKTNFSNLEEKFEKLRQAHADKSRSASEGMFKGGLAEHTGLTTQFHTATHLLHQALRDVLGDHVEQMGSNITGERLRFDFKHHQKMTDEEKSRVEEIINQKISQDLPVTKTIQAKQEALSSGALAFFREKYTDPVTVYTIGNDPEKDWYSKELCGGPHVNSTGEISPVRILKEKAVSAGVRRLYIVSKDK